MTEQELKEKFLKDHEDDINKGVYEDVDIKRLKEDSKLLTLYLIHNKGDVAKAAEFMHTSLSWRKTFGIKDLSSSSFPAEFLALNFVFFSNKDRIGKSLMHVQFSKMKKDATFIENAKKFLAWQIEKAFNANMGQTIVVLMDMSNAGLNNVDTNFVKFLISCFTSYYPCMLEYLLIVELPWILSAVWTLVKGWLSPEQQAFVTVVKKNGLQKYIAPDQLFTHLGGTCDIAAFSAIDSKELPFLPLDLSQELCRTPTNTPSKKLNNKMLKQYSVESQVPQASLSPLSTVVECKSKSNVNNVTLSPPECILFDLNQTSDNIISTLTITNPSPFQVAFKVKTTSPDLFKVRPVMGTIQPLAHQKISVSILQGKTCDSSRDKFLVMLMTIKEETTDEANIVNLWKTVSKHPENFVEHKLFCKLIPATRNDPLPNGHQPARPVTNEEVVEQLRQINRNQMFIAILLIAIVFRIFIYPNWLI